MFQCPYTEKCQSALGKDCATIVKANEKEQQGYRAQGRIDVCVCQVNHQFNTDVKEV